MLAGAGLAILVVALTLVTARSITRPLYQLAEACKRASGGEYATRVEARRQDEIGDLAGEPGQVAALLDHGLRTFSVAPGALGPVKAAIARYSGPAA